MTGETPEVRSDKRRREEREEEEKERYVTQFSDHPIRHQT